jgi:prepilin-type N-terminal cleavage/methylation domain-containing protein
MKKYFFNKLDAFTLIELVMVLLILAILTVVAIPKFVDLTGKAETAAESSLLSAYQSAFAVSIADISAFPTVTQFQTYLQGSSAPVTGQIPAVTVGSKSCSVTLFTNTSCSAAATANADTVKCVQPSVSCTS